MCDLHPDFVSSDSQMMFGGGHTNELTLPPPHSAWDLVTFLAAYDDTPVQCVATSKYTKHLIICDACEMRRANACIETGCYRAALSIKLQSRGFACPTREF